MSMSLLTLFQFLETLAAYLFVTLVIPCFVLSKKLSHYRFMDRVLLYFIIGNFYATNLVFLLQLLYISNVYTLWTGLLVIPAIIWGRLNHFPFFDRLRSLGHSVKKLLTGALGIRSMIDDLQRNVWRRFIGGLKKAWGNIRRNWLDWLLITALILMVMWVYGIRMLTQFGYAASDVPVHIYWVNGLSENHIFVAGIYPHGMHAIIYLINELFGIDTYVIFRVFALVQCLAVHMMALLFLKLCCKSRYAAYGGVFLYAIGSNCFREEVLWRYLSTLPQEYSMIYILPTVYYAFCFIREKRRELEEDLPEKESMIALAGLIMSFSLCVTAHFYGMVIAGLFCIGIALGCLRWLIKPVYFKRIIMAAFISMAIAVLPMGVAFATGTPLEGSLYWASAVISGTAQGEEEWALDSITQSEDAQNVEAQDDSGPIFRLLETATSFPKNLWEITGSRLENFILGDIEAEEWYSIAIRGMIVFLIVAGIVLLKRERMYSAILLSTGAFMFLMSVMFSATGLGIPELMFPDRTGIFYTYMLILVIGFTVDVCVWVVAGLSESKRLMGVLSFTAMIAILICIWQQGMIRKPLTNNGLETNEAITCLAQIIATEPDYSWTIFSANDETRMVFGHGFHYELSTFLVEIMTLDEAVTVPTETVYFFIEKIPLDYQVSYEGSGQSVSIEGAKKLVYSGEGLGAYQGENRWIIMSHMYYWAQEFKRLYPNEMKVYLETDQFVCYRLEQNPYRLYDLAIDYGYNRGDTSAELEER